jgi:hypothetical protein
LSSKTKLNVSADVEANMGYGMKKPTKKNKPIKKK